MIIPRAIFVCNALEDETRIERGITSDSPAASKKIFLMAKALKKVGVFPVIVSMGRGQASSFIGKFFKSKILIHEGIPIIYAPFCETPILSQIISLISLPFLLFRLRLYKGKTSVIFYNRTSAYISSLFMSAMLSYRRVLDLEDGEFFNDNYFSFHQIFIKTKRFLYSKFSNGGTILACSALSNSAYNNNELCYYGAVNEIAYKKSDYIIGDNVKILLGGTVSFDTGAGNLIKAIKSLHHRSEPWISRLEFHITGKGNCIDLFKEFEGDEFYPNVKVYGRLSDNKYAELISKCNVGLALKPNNGKLANTTFPSKVIEIASSGLLVLTTDISDVRDVLGSGALYLKDDNVDTLVESLELISNDRAIITKIANQGIDSVQSICSLNSAGLKLSKHIFNEK